MKTFLLITLIVISKIIWSQSQLERLEKSPRHHDWVILKTPSKKIKSFLSYPEVAENIPVVIFIHQK